MPWALMLGVTYLFLDVTPFLQRHLWCPLPCVHVGLCVRVCGLVLNALNLMPILKERVHAYTPVHV